MPVLCVLFVTNTRIRLIRGRRNDPGHPFYFDQRVVMPNNNFFKVDSPFRSFSPSLFEVCQYIVGGRTLDFAVQIMPWLSRSIRINLPIRKKRKMVL